MDVSANDDNFIFASFDWERKQRVDMTPKEIATELKERWDYECSHISVGRALKANGLEPRRNGRGMLYRVPPLHTTQQDAYEAYLQRVPVVDETGEPTLGALARDMRNKDIDATWVLEQARQLYCQAYEKGNLSLAKGCLDLIGKHVSVAAFDDGARININNGTDTTWDINIVRPDGTRIELMDKTNEPSGYLEGEVVETESNHKH